VIEGALPQRGGSLITYRQISKEVEREKYLFPAAPRHDQRDQRNQIDEIDE
jgi:hypothetical protein